MRKLCKEHGLVPDALGREIVADQFVRVQAGGGCCASAPSVELLHMERNNSPGFVGPPPGRPHAGTETRIYRVDSPSARD